MWLGDSDGQRRRRKRDGYAMKRALVLLVLSLVMASPLPALDEPQGQNQASTNPTPSNEQIASTTADVGGRFARVRRAAGDVWGFELATVEERPLTVGKVLVALGVLLIGVLIARRVTRRVARGLFARLGLEVGAAAAFETLGFYAALVVLVVFALWISGIPLTVFTLAGGALAIGIGFGSQNLINNFISGLILLAERPIKVGDLVELDQVVGLIEEIGARSTRVRTFENSHLIVPNSAFLENKVINWTHGDNLVRLALNVGVAYGSPTRLVESLILQAITEHPMALAEPPPSVLFDDFGDSALVFQGLLWIRMHRPMDRRRTLSDLRYRIDELFREHGIVIAFPQRDIHIDAAHPLEVRMLGDDDTS
jgi:potassium efflux system protein